MKILYCSNVCSENTYEKFFSNSNNKPGQQVQKYHRVLLRGLGEQKEVQVTAISKLSTNKANCSKRWIKGFEEKWHEVLIKYMPACNISVVSFFLQMIFAFWYIAKEKKDKSTVVILDVLNVSMGVGVLVACKLFSVNLMGIVTDLPEMISKNPKSIGVKITNNIIAGCDSYLLLTEAMNLRVNKKNKPYIIIEGQVDSYQVIDVDVEKYEKKVCLYSGSLDRIHGIEYLVKGFAQADIEDAELHIYGGGDYADELLKIALHNKNIKYMGVRLNKEVIVAQKKSTLLINPRPTTQEFVKYSFPSKNMEYMASGTPMLTTRLPGMPTEYYPYIYILDDESADGIAKVLTKILNTDDKVLYRKGQEAKQFVMMNKNGYVQAKKIVDFISKV